MPPSASGGEKKAGSVPVHFHPKLEGQEAFISVVSLTALCSQSSQRNHGRLWEVPKHWTPAPSAFDTQSAYLAANMDEWITTTAVFEEGGSWLESGVGSAIHTMTMSSSRSQTMAVLVSLVGRSGGDW